mgnify:CR=1 FL=1
MRSGANTASADPDNYLDQTSGKVAGYLYAQDAYSQPWEMKTRASVNWNSRSMSDIGVIAPGRAADLVAVDGDPLSDLSALRRISAVLREGRVVVGAPPLESP